MPIWRWKWISHQPCGARFLSICHSLIYDIHGNGIMAWCNLQLPTTQWVRIVKFQNMRLSWFQLSRPWGDLVHMCADDAICGLLENMIGGKVLSAARWRNTHKEQHRKMEGFRNQANDLLNGNYCKWREMKMCASDAGMQWKPLAGLFQQPPAGCVYINLWRRSYHLVGLVAPCGE